MTSQIIDPEIFRKIPIFKFLSDNEINTILNAPENGIEDFAMKQPILREEEIGDCMYIVLEGSVNVSIRSGTGGRDIDLATLRTGDFFGEQALIPGGTGRRNASVTAYQDTKLFRIDKKYVELSVEGELDESEDVTVPAVIKKKSEVRKMIEGMRLFKSLKEGELENVGLWTEIINTGPGDFVLKEAEHGDCLFVVLDGTVEIFTIDDNGKVVILAEHNRGNYFGEQALMPGSSGERNAYARSNDAVKLIKIPKSFFRLVLTRDSEVLEQLKAAGENQKQQLGQIHNT